MISGCLLDSVSRNAGGLLDATRGLSKAMETGGDAVRVFGLEDGHTREDLTTWRPLAVHTFPRELGGWSYGPELLSTMISARLDVLHSHGLWKYGSVVSLRWARHTRRPVIIHPHGMLDPWAVRNSRWKKRLAALLYESAHLRIAHCIRALCESEAQSIRAFGLRNPICIIPNGIELPLLEAGSNEQGVQSRALLPPDLRPLISGGGKVLLYLGRLHPKKNLGPLLHAWAALQKDSAAARDWTLAIAGWDQGGYEEELKELSRELGLSGEQESGSKLQAPSSKPVGSVIFLGPQFNEAKAACYANCSAFILPSLSEGLPMVVLEAWAYARPVLMTDECNLPEGFAAGAALRIGTAADAIMPGLRQLMEMSDMNRTAMGAHGRALVAEKFLWPGIGDEMRCVCEWAVGGGAPPESVRLKN